MSIRRKNKGDKMQNNMVVLSLLDSDNRENTSYSYSPSGYALALAVSNVSRKFKRKTVQLAIEEELRKGEELTFILVEGNSMPLTVSDNLWECLNTLRVSSEDDLSTYDLELNDSEGGVIFRVDGVFTDKGGLLKGVSNFKSVADRLIDGDSVELTSSQVDFIDTVTDNIQTLEDLQRALREGTAKETLAKISDEMEDLLKTRKDNSEFRHSWENLREQLLADSSQSLIGDVPPHLLVEVKSPFDVYVDIDENTNQEDAKDVLEAQLKGYLPYQYGADGSMYLHLNGSVLRENAYNQFSAKGVRYNNSFIDGLQKDYGLKPYLTYGEAVILYIIAKGGSLELPTTEIDSVFKSVLQVGLESQKEFLSIWFYGPEDILGNIYKHSQKLSLDDYVKFCETFLPFELYFGFLYVLYRDNLFNCIKDGLPDFTSEISRLDFARLVAKLSD